MHHTYTLMSSLKTLGIKKVSAHLGRLVKVTYVAMKAKATLLWPISNVLAQYSQLLSPSLPHIILYQAQIFPSIMHLPQMSRIPVSGDFNPIHMNLYFAAYIYITAGHDNSRHVL
jgi:hypothetical protein